MLLQENKPLDGCHFTRTTVLHSDQIQLPTFEALFVFLFLLFACILWRQRVTPCYRNCNLSPVVYWDLILPDTFYSTQCTWWSLCCKLGDEMFRCKRRSRQSKNQNKLWLKWLDETLPLCILYNQGLKWGIKKQNHPRRNFKYNHENHQRIGPQDFGPR